MEGDRIEIGDIVYIQINDRAGVAGTVQHVPAATGDAWHIVDIYHRQGLVDGLRKGTLYVQIYQYMELMERRLRNEQI